MITLIILAVVGIILILSGIAFLIHVRRKGCVGEQTFEPDNDSSSDGLDLEPPPNTFTKGWKKIMGFISTMAYAKHIPLSEDVIKKAVFGDLDPEAVLNPDGSSKGEAYKKKATIQAVRTEDDDPISVNIEFDSVFLKPFGNIEDPSFGRDQVQVDETDNDGDIKISINFSKKEEN